MGVVFTISEASRPDVLSVVGQVCEVLDGLELVVPYTTRPPRSAQDDGFVFTSQDVFERMIASEEFLEYVEVFGHYYGTPLRLLQEALDDGKDPLIRVDERGLAQVKQKRSDAVSILVLPSRFGQREPDAESVTCETLLYRHFHDASQVLNQDKFDHVVANDRIEESVNRVVAIIRFERARRA